MQLYDLKDNTCKRLFCIPLLGSRSIIMEYKHGMKEYIATQNVLNVPILKHKLLSCTPLFKSKFITVMSGKECIVKSLKASGKPATLFHVRVNKDLYFLPLTTKTPATNDSLLPKQVHFASIITKNTLTCSAIDSDMPAVGELRISCLTEEYTQARSQMHIYLV